MKKILCCLLFAAIFLTGCTSPDSQGANKLVDNNKETAQKPNGTSKQEDDIENPDDNSEEGAIENPTDAQEEEVLSSNDDIIEDNISDKVKSYIMNGQENKPEAQKIKWSNTFLNKVDIESLYKQYISSGGNTDNLENIVEYVTLNAPIPSDWEKLFEKDLYEAYGEEVIRLEHLEGDLYQAYIKKDGKEIPYVVVSSRTGYFHG